MMTGAFYSLPRKEAVKAVAHLHSSILFSPSESSKQDLWPSRLLLLRCIPLFLSPFFQSPAPQGGEEEAEQLLQVSPVFYFNTLWWKRKDFSRTERGKGHKAYKGCLRRM